MRHTPYQIQIASAEDAQAMAKDGFWQYEGIKEALGKIIFDGVSYRDMGGMEIRLIVCLNGDIDARISRIVHVKD